MQTERIFLPYRSEEWMQFRKQGIGGSDAAAVLGLSKWKSNTELWEEKVGLRIPSDVVSPRVEYGLLAEAPMLRLFQLDHANEYDVIEYKDTVFKRGCMFASIDGGLTDKRTGAYGGLEIKTAAPMSRTAWDAWDDQIPMSYYAQILHYMAVTGWRFWIVKVRLIGRDRYGSPLITEKEYRFDYDREEKNIMDLVREEHAFWQHVVTGTRPHPILPRI